LCDPGNECVLNPPVGKKWYYTVPQTFDEEIQALERASWNQRQRELPDDIIDLVSKAKSLVQERDKLDNEEREAKRRCLVASTDSCEKSSNFTVISNSSVNNSSEATSVPMPPQLPPGDSIWWDSMDAFMLFNGNKDIETAVDRVSDLIAVLNGANETATSYKTIVEGNATDDTMSENQMSAMSRKWYSQLMMKGLSGCHLRRESKQDRISMGQQ
jgi:hypothetical protein